MSDRGHQATPPERLTFAEAAHAIRDELLAVQNAPHENFEGHGGLCPICGLTTSLLAKLREETDALALAEHIAANLTPPSSLCAPLPRRGL